MDRLKKTDRMLRIWFLIMRNPLRFNTRELADKFSVNVRTIYRDLDTLGAELGVPVYEDHARWAVKDDYFLPPIRFTMPEAMTVFLAVRLMLDHGRRYEPNTESTFSVLASVLPAPLKDQVMRTLDWMHGLPKDEVYLRNMARLAEAWTSQHRVKITYRSLEAEEASERLIDPYFIQPAAIGHSSYVIAYCHRACEMRSFKIERIEHIEVTGETYVIPADFDANKYFGSAWGVVVSGEAKTIRLKFDSAAGRIIGETAWHPSQVVERKRDGSVVLTLKVMDTVDLFSWILGWGVHVEVLAPEELRQAVANAAKEMLSKHAPKAGKIIGE